MLAGVDEVELTIEKLVSGGDGLGRFQGIPIFVARSAPGDRARVRVVERHPDFGRGEIVELLEPGPGRRAAPCPHFAECGGCDLQHLDEREQLRWKCTATMETLGRLSRLELPPPVEILAGAPWAYRLRTQLHTGVEAGRVRVGYHARGSRRLVPISSCRVLEPALERAALELAEGLAPGAPSRIDLVSGDDGAIAAAPPAGGFASGEIVRRIGGFDYRFDARCFFQGHAGLVERFVARVVGAAEGETAFDLFGGVGLFALPLARRYRRVVVVEGDRIAVRYARKNARLARLDHVECVGQAVESWMPGGFPEHADRVVVDPPRAGLPFVACKLLAARPAR
ncbi:MAG TPA: TRAM domain-containing protein, partial [Thermoanaerobaculia bacterium]|nr:TRAM domain-containing protein [Thermoanaerobaculia bacterium]